MRYCQRRRAGGLARFPILWSPASGAAGRQGERDENLNADLDLVTNIIAVGAHAEFGTIAADADSAERFQRVALIRTDPTQADAWRLAGQMAGVNRLLPRTDLEPSRRRRVAR